jgi:hypothetical protein
LTDHLTGRKASLGASGTERFMMDIVFKATSVIFAFLSVVTGSLAIYDPTEFSAGFGLPLISTAATTIKTRSEDVKDKLRSTAESYISLMGVRQLAMGLIILLFAYQGKWNEIATILALIGILVAGTDGIYIARGGGTTSAGQRHAIPGALISALASYYLYSKA